MTAYRPKTSPNTQAARLSAVAFAWLGAVAVLIAVFAILVGSPNRAYDLAPIGGLGDLGRRFGEISPLVAATVAGIVAAVVAAFVGARRLDAVGGGLQLFVLGGVVLACVAGEFGRIGHSADGGVLIATLVCVAGGAAIAAGGIVALLGRG
jgi:hypothetical protein